MTDQKKMYTDRVKLSRSNFNSETNRYKAVSKFKNGEEISFEFEPSEYINNKGENCIGNLYIPGYEYYIAIKTRQSQTGKIYYSGCINYEKSFFVNMNIIPTQDSIKEYTISFSKPVDALEAIPDNGVRTDGLPF